MSTIYQPADESVLIALATAVEQYHPDLKQAGVTFAVLMASPGTDKHGEPKEGPALKENGYPAAATIRAHKLRDKALGLADVLICIDEEYWKQANKKRRLALLDHELYHLDLQEALDDLGRPTFKIRRHDYEIGVFNEVAERHGVASVERSAIEALIHQSWVQTTLNLPMQDAAD